jgi:PadR family transcriptional regulator PadR
MRTGHRATRKVLQTILDSDGAEHYGYGLIQQIHVSSGTLYPILMRLEADGWLESRWKDDGIPGRPRRRAYRMTPLGTEGARAALAAG